MNYLANKDNIIWMDYIKLPNYIEKFIKLKNNNLDLIVCSRFLKEH